MTVDAAGCGAWEKAVRESIDGLAPTERVPKHRALALLAVRYAATLDANEEDAEALSVFGPKLQSALVALGCAPAKSAPISQPAQVPSNSPGGGESDGGQRVPTLAERRERHKQQKAAWSNGA